MDNTNNLNEVRAWLYALMGEHDFTIPWEAFQELTHRLSATTADQATQGAEAVADIEPMRSGWPYDRSAEMLTAYAELVKITGRYAEEHYIPEISDAADELRKAAELVKGRRPVYQWSSFDDAQNALITEGLRETNPERIATIKKALAHIDAAIELVRP